MLCNKGQVRSGDVEIAESRTSFSVITAYDVRTHYDAIVGVFKEAYSYQLVEFSF